jgi:uncharacterized membrane protein
MSDNQPTRIPESLGQKASRVFALDALRGLAIAVMALDHANQFVAHKHPPGEMWDGVFPIYYDPLAFLTRLVTHLAPSGFFFLMGAGMLLFARSRQRQGWSRWAVLRHFWIRGALLMGLQLLIVNRAWELPPEGWSIKIYIGVLFALGGTMILASLLLWLRPAFLAFLALGLFVGMEFTHPGLGMWNVVSQAPVWVIFLRSGGTQNLYAFYPILPWLELVVLGLLFGHWVADDPRKAFSRAWKLGLGFLFAFAVVRAFDGFGNIRPRIGNSWIDFLNPVKYPPSMAFTLLTMGVNLILLWAFSRAADVVRRALRPLVVLGQSPLLFYVLHLFLYWGLGRLLAPDGSSIPAMLPVWLLGMLLLLPFCLWYGGWKRRQPVGSLWRFL